MSILEGKATTVSLPPDLVVWAKIQAINDGTTLRQLVIEGLQRVKEARRRGETRAEWEESHGDV